MIFTVNHLTDIDKTKQTAITYNNIKSQNNQTRKLLT